MSSMKNILAAASLAVLSAAGITTAAAQPWDHHGWRAYERHERFEHRATVGRVRLAQALRFHRYRMIGEPYFVHDRYVVRTMTASAVSFSSRSIPIAEPSWARFASNSVIAQSDWIAP